MNRTLSKGLRVATWVALVLVVLYAASFAAVFAVMHQPPKTMARYMDRVPDLLWTVLPMETMWRYCQRGPLQSGDVAPDFDLATLDGASHVKLSSLRGRPVVLFFGSYTCPPFRKRMPDMNKLYEPYRNRADFYFIYVEEAHATDGWPSPSNKRDRVLYANAQSLADRVKAGGACAHGLKIPFPMLVDGMNNEAEQAYRAWPIRVYVVDKDGRIAWKSAPGPFGFVADEIKQALNRYVGAPATPAAVPAT